MRASTTSLSDGNYVLVAMNNKGTGPVIYDPNAGGGKYYRCEISTTLAAGDVVSSKYVWTIDVTNDDGVQHITVKNYNDKTKAFPDDGAKNLNFTGSGVASLKTEVKTINGLDYIALSSKIDDEGNVVTDTVTKYNLIYNLATIPSQSEVMDGMEVSDLESDFDISATAAEYLLTEIQKIKREGVYWDILD
jgi:hypothetical protein